jgi:hypothetical protein
MSAIDDPKTLGRARLSFADQHDIDEFIATLEKFERGEYNHGSHSPAGRRSGGLARAFRAAPHAQAE